MNPANEQPTTERRSTTPEQPGARWARRARAIGLWARDTGLGITGFIVVLVVAISGWSASFIGLHQFGMDHMGFTAGQAWLVPITFDGAAAGLSLVVFRASIHGRGAPIWRLLIIAFTALSSWINYVHIDDLTGRWIACYMPPSAVILFEGLMSEARAAYSRRGGKERPRVHVFRWLVDFSGTWAIYRNYVLGIELPEHLQHRPDAAPTLESAATGNATAPTEDAPAVASSMPASVDSTAPVVAPPGDSSAPTTVDSSTASGPTTGATTGDSASDKSTAKLPPARRQKLPRAGGRKAATRRSMDEWVDLAGPVFHAEFRRLRRQPTANEFAQAIKAAKLGTVSDSTAKNIRAEILDRAELPALD